MSYIRSCNRKRISKAEIRIQGCMAWHMLNNNPFKNPFLRECLCDCKYYLYLHSKSCTKEVGERNIETENNESEAFDSK